MTDEKKELTTDSEKPGADQRRISRRSFLKGAGATAAGFVAVSAVSCEPTSQVPTGRITANPTPTFAQYPEVPSAPLVIPDPDILNFFTPHEARTVEALAATILPGTPDDPGAREAGVIVYIDHVLSHPDGFAQGIYRQPPFAQGYEGESPPDEARQAPVRVLWVPKDELERYGLQTIMTPREQYRLGVVYVDRYANELFGMNFADLTEEQQNTIVGAMADGEATGFGEPSAQEFFEILRQDIIEGMFADPAYGGNRNLVGWELIGYPGAQRAYTPRDILTEGTYKEPQSLVHLPVFHPGEPHEHAIVPVSGADQQAIEPENRRTEPER